MFRKRFEDLEEKLQSIQQENQQFKEMLANMEVSLTKRIGKVDKNVKALSADVVGTKETAKNTLKLSKYLLDEMARYTILYKRSSARSVRGSIALAHLIENYNFQTVLDIGCGEGIHSEIFLKAEKTVTAIDYGKSVYFSKRKAGFNAIVADFTTYEFEEQFDCVWCSHVLEHQLNVNVFLKKCFSVLKDGGILSITVPPAKAAIVSGHVTLWNAGLLCYNLILAGFDCSEAVVETYDYDISITVRKKSVPQDVLEKIGFDVGDLKLLRNYFPLNIHWIDGKRDISFDGDLLVKKEKSAIRAENNREKPVQLSRFIEITTKVGCSLHCAYCPQDVFIKAYMNGNSKPVLQLSLENFKKALSHIPIWLDICFTGFSEPFENPHAFQMVEYAVKAGYKVHIYTTLKAISIAEIDRLRDLDVKSYVIHVQDRDGMMSLEADEEYLTKLDLFARLELPNTKYVCIGKPLGLIPDRIVKRIKEEKAVILRAGNLKIDDKMTAVKRYHPNCGRSLKKDQKVLCNRRLQYKGVDRKVTHVESPIMLPDGRVILCCQDFGLKHILGNLLEDDYESIMYGEAMRTIEDSMMCKNTEEILCRSCEFALEYNESRWNDFLITGRYDQ